MKKMILMVAVLAMSLTAKAWEVGDFYDQDPTGVPSMVVYVDESGEHGLIMSPCAMTDKQYKEIVKKKVFAKNKKFYEKWYIKMPRKKVAKMGDQVALQAFDAQIAQNEEIYNRILAWFETAPRLYDGKLKEKDERKALEEFAAQNTEYGEDNQNAIIAYCQEKGIDITQYFRQNDWAMQLGEGWFIPGNYELELFNKFFAEGVGKKYKYPLISTEPIAKNGAFQGKSWGYTFGVTLYPWTKILSSTMVKSAWSENEDNKDKTGKYVENKGGLVGVIAQAADKDNYYALCAFQNIEGYWWMFAYNIQQESSYVAFKRF